MEISQNELLLVSVIIPVYNGEKTLIATINSVLNQTYQNFEIIVVDDGSKNPTRSFLEENCSDPRICVIRTARSNANVARNVGIKASSGDYIAMLDADDLWLENHLQDCLNLLQNSDADGLYGSIFISHHPTHDNYKQHICYARELKAGESMVDYLLTTVCGAQTSGLFTTANSSKSILWDEKLIEHQDYDFVVRFNKQYKLVVKFEPSVIYSSLSGRPFHFDTNIDFIEQNKDDIHPVIYNQYNLKMYVQALRCKLSPVKTLYFQREATRFKEFMSYQSYISILNPVTRTQEWMCKFKYVFYILGIKTELQAAETEDWA
jgi:glycosyltransferase involved in cell wall biosynthesis